ncbi:MAG: hypothetical protein JW712_04825 [Dehalococcoidales bacterium]|nr:hypothetical protein [Dehalococcoidales bacterium]
MKKLIIFLIIILLVPGISCTVRQDADIPSESNNYEFKAKPGFTANEKVIFYKDFDITSESTKLDTSVRGTIFISGSEDLLESAQIIAWVDIDPDDWGGVMFGISNEWDISTITSSYPGDGTIKKPEESIAIWNTLSARYKFNKMIEIGTNRYKPTGGGVGMVVIQLNANSDSLRTTDVLHFTIGVGSSETDGIRSIFPDYFTIEISNQDSNN